MSESVATAQVIRTFGDETRFEAADLPLPAAPGRTQARVAVKAAAVNPVDLTTRAGVNISSGDARFPMVLGWDLAGVVTAIGDGVTAVAVGDRVAAMTFQPLDQNGSYRNVIDLDAQLLASVPAALDLRAAATVPLSGLTGSQLVDRTGVDAGDLLLVNAPLGAVGRFVVQVAAARGVHVVGIAAESRADEARALGVTTVVPRGLEGAELVAALPGSIDAAVDLIGGKAAHATFGAVRDGGTYVTAVGIGLVLPVCVGRPALLLVPLALVCSGTAAAARRVRRGGRWSSAPHGPALAFAVAGLVLLSQS